jgi:hypothetical protein
MNIKTAHQNPGHYKPNFKTIVSVKAYKIQIYNVLLRLTLLYVTEACTVRTGGRKLMFDENVLHKM